MMLSKHGLREAEARKMMWDVLTKGRHANIMAEGDDGIHAFVKELVEMFGGVCEFGKLWCSCYAEYGFQIEPQGNQGEVIPEDCLAPTTQRMEFCSKIFVAVEKYTYSFPKPSKVSNSLSTSFNVNVPRHDACATKAVALMASCVNQPLVFELCACLYEEHRKEGGRAVGNILAETFSTRDTFAKHVFLSFDGKDGDISGHSFYQKLLTEHWNFVCDGDAALAMMQAFERETGIDVQAQEDLMVNLRRDTVTALLRALRC